MNAETLYQSVFDVHDGGTPIGGACSIWLQGSIRLLTAYHVSHDTKNHNAPRSLIFRNRSGDVTLRNVMFTKVPGSRDISWSDPLDIEDGLHIAPRYGRGNGYATLRSAVSIIPPQYRIRRVSDEKTIPMRNAPRYLYIKSQGQKVDFGFSGKPVVDADLNVAGIIVAKQRFFSGWYGVAELLRQRVFQK